MAEIEDPMLCEILKSFAIVVLCLGALAAVGILVTVVVLSVMADRATEDAMREKGE